MNLARLGRSLLHSSRSFFHRISVSGNGGKRNRESIVSIGTAGCEKFELQSVFRDNSVLNGVTSTRLFSSTALRKEALTGIPIIQRFTMPHSTEGSVVNSDANNATLSPSLVQLNPISQLPIILTGSSNFSTWKAQIEMVLHGHDLHGYLDGSVTAPSSIVGNDKNIQNTALEHWVRQDKLIQTVLLTSVHPTLASMIAVARNSKHAWDSLHTRFANKSQDLSCNHDDLAQRPTPEDSTSDKAEEFHGDDFGGEEFNGEEFHGEDFDKEDFEGDEIYRTIEFTTRVPIASKKVSG